MQQIPPPSVSSIAANVASAFAPTGESVLSLRLTQDYVAEASGRPILADVCVSKPPKAYFWQARTGEEWSTILYTLDASKLGSDGIFAVAPDVVPLIQDQVRLVQIRLVVTSQGVPYLVPVPLAGPDGRQNLWYQSLARCVELAETRWIRISASKLRSGYDVFEAISNLPAPQWPTETFEQILEIAFRNRVITSESHPLVQQLLGAA